MSGAATTIPVLLIAPDTRDSASGAAFLSTESVTVDQLYDQYSRYVAAIGLRLLGNDSEVDDLVQDVFLDAVRGIGKLRDPKATRGWLATLTVRTARRRLRRNRIRRLLVGNESPDYARLVDHAASPEQRLLLTRTYQVLDTLPANQRLAWILRHVEGESLTAVALRCECSLASAKRYIARAHARLQKEFGHE